MKNQFVETYCIRRKDDKHYNFSPAYYVEKFAERKLIINQVATTSFMENGMPVIAYTFLLEKQE